LRQITFKGWEGRTKRKLEFAKIHLEELTSHPELGSSSEFEQAHEESFFFHVIGAKDSFLQEINVAYSLGLNIWDVKEYTLMERLKLKQLQSPELNKIIELEEREKERNDRGSWLAMAIEERNQGTHRFHIRRYHKVKAGSNSGSTSYYTNPFTQEPMELTILEFLRQCLMNMEDLLNQLRKTLSK